MTSSTLKKASRLEVESREDFFSEYAASDEWSEVVLDEDTLKMNTENSLLLAEDTDDRKW